MNPNLQNDTTLILERSRAAQFVTLTKPELTFLSVLTALGGAYLGLQSSTLPNGLLLLHVLIGTLLVGGGAGTLNQYIERHHDARMKRTAGRPIPAGRITPGEALFFGSLLSVSGFAYLSVTTNLLAAGLAGLTILSYLFLYTPLKRLTWASTIVGGIPGALPPVIGWTAAGNGLTVEAAALFMILFFWQMPHFFSLAWMYRKDYEAAGFRMLSVVDPSGRKTGAQITGYTVGLILASILLFSAAELGTIYLLGSFLIGILFLIPGVRFAVAPTNVSARRVFLASLAYIPLLLTIIVVDRL